MGTQLPLQKGALPSNFRPMSLLSPGQMAGWIKMPLGVEVGLGPGDVALDGDAAAPIFSPCLLRPNGWMYQDTTWYGGRPRPRQHCVRWGPSPQLSANVYCGRTAGWIKMPLGMEVDLGLGHIVLDGDPVTPRKGHSSPPLYGPCLLWPLSPISATAELLFCMGHSYCGMPIWCLSNAVNGCDI